MFKQFIYLFDFLFIYLFSILSTTEIYLACVLKPASVGVMVMTLIDYFDKRKINKKVNK